MIFKRIASVCFAIAFILAIAVFTNYLGDIISKQNAKYGIIVFGGIALLMNLLSFRFDKNTENNNPVFWVGSVLIFVGLILKMQNQILNQYILIAGLSIVGLSYFYNPFKKEEDTVDDDLLDN